MIKLPRGNSAAFSLMLTNGDGTVYVPSENDTVIFTVKKSRSRNAAALLVKKIVPSDNMVITIDPADTIGMAEGDYYYDVAVCIGGSGFYTVVLCDEFKLLPALGDMEMI